MEKNAYIGHILSFASIYMFSYSSVSLLPRYTIYLLSTFVQSTQNRQRWLLPTDFCFPQ